VGSTGREENILRRKLKQASQKRSEINTPEIYVFLKYMLTLFYMATRQFVASDPEKAPPSQPERVELFGNLLPFKPYVMDYPMS
jgi:hypothetical protein